jgi:glutathione peroxidase
MHKTITSIVVALFFMTTLYAQNTKEMPTIYDFKALNNKGEEVDMAQYKGKVLMIVNTASKCGFTPQYDGLEALYKKYKDQGLVILGFPCDQFKHQEPGSDEEIAEFCRLNHGVTFPLMKKIDVFGENAHPIFKYLTQQVPTEEVHGLKDKATMKLVDGLSKSEGREEGGVRWNFTKFLISKDGSVIKRFAPVAKPQDMEAEIENMLK